MNSYAQLPFYTNLERYFMKQRIMLTIAAMTVEISHVKNQLEKMKGDTSLSVFDWKYPRDGASPYCGCPRLFSFSVFD